MSKPTDIYFDFFGKHVAPLVAKMHKDLGHKFDTIVLNISNSHAPNMSINPSNGEITASTAFFDVLQEGNFNTVSRETKAVIAHEVAGHLGHHQNLVKNRKLPLIAGPIIAITAYELIKHFSAKKTDSDDIGQGITEADKTKTGHTELNDKIYNAAKYVALGALGLAGGGFVSRYMSRAAEFSADRRAIEYTKDPEALVSALTKLHQSIDHLIASGATETKNIKQWLQKRLFDFSSATYQAHPSLAQRTDYIRSISI